MLIQDFCLHLIFSVKTVNVVITINKYLFCLTCLFLLICFLFIFIAGFVDHIALIYSDYKDSMILNYFSFYCHNLIICIVLSYLVNLNFSFLGLLIVYIPIYEMSSWLYFFPHLIISILDFSFLDSHSVYSANFQL